MAIDRVVPSERNNTYTPTEVSRKSMEELFDTAFNEDQKKVLLSMFTEEGGSDSGGGVPALYELTAEQQGDGMLFTLYASYNDIVSSNGGVAHINLGVDVYTPLMAWAGSNGSYRASVNLDGTQLNLDSENADANLTYFQNGQS